MFGSVHTENTPGTWAKSPKKKWLYFLSILSKANFAAFK